MEVHEHAAGAVDGVARGTLDGAQRLKESLARYRGATCGVAYAEALSAANAYPQAIF